MACWPVLTPGAMILWSTALTSPPTAPQNTISPPPTPTTERAVITRADDDSIQTLEDLNGKTTANTISSTYAQLAEQYGATVTAVDDLNQTFELLNSGRIDATLNAEVTFYDYTKEHPDANVKIAVLTDDANEVAIPMQQGRGDRNPARCHRYRH